MAEVSVVWLLFLGVFLVVVSSGVLAATQWRNFSPIGQYGILFAYTLMFWVASTWTGKQASLQLTARMLKIATLLIIPVNFWMMDGFWLWASPLGMVMAAIASLILSGITLFILKTSPNANPIWMIATAIGLSWLNWGWHWPGVPFAAIYLGTLGATLALVVQDEHGRRLGRGSGEWGIGSGSQALEEGRGAGSREQGDRSQALEEGRGAGSREQGNRSQEPGVNQNPKSGIRGSSEISLSAIAVTFTTLLLLLRAVWVAQVPINQVGLAIGVCGWLLCWLARGNRERFAWNWLGTGLLILAWLVTVTVTPPWQAIAISGLGLWLLITYLRRLGQIPYLTASFFVGLQMCWLVWQSVPFSTQQQVIQFAMQWAGTEMMPVALLGIGPFPYVLLTVGGAFSLRRWQRVDLANHAEWLALGLGFTLTAISLGNPLVRSLNLIFSTLTLVFVLAFKAQSAAPLIYLTHFTGLVALISSINWAFPTLDFTLWAAIFLGLMLFEWGFSSFLQTHPPTHPLTHPPTSPPVPSPPVPSPHLPWQDSAWWAGVIFAGLSYLLLGRQVWLEETHQGWIWLVTPIALTLLGTRSQFPYTRAASWFSVGSLILLQALMFDSAPGRFVGLGLATLLMVQNTRQLRHLLAASLSVAFGLGFAAATFWEILGNRLTVSWFLVLMAGMVLLLWFTRGWLVRRRGLLAQLYGQATDGWAIALTILTLVAFTMGQSAIYLTFMQPNWQYVLAGCLLFVATLYRNWQSSSDLGYYAIAASLELLVSSALALQGPSLTALATANIALGFVTQLAGDWQITHSPSSSHPPTLPPSSLTSWHLVPILYAFLGFLIQHHSFTATTGLYTLAAALVGIGVGRRLPALKPLTYLSLLGVSFAAYELLIYQLSQAKGGDPGDGIVLLAVLAALLAIGYCLLQRCLATYLRLTRQNVRIVAHTHWALGNFWLLSALFLPQSHSGQWLWFGVAAGLTIYALVMGNRRWNREQEPWVISEEIDIPAVAGRPLPSGTDVAFGFWIYAGLVEATIAFAYLLHLLLPDRVLIDWAGAIAAIVAIPLYFSPWEEWGWDERPWKQTSVVLPGIAVATTAAGINLQSLLVVAAFYAWLANTERRTRFSYISLLLADWALFRWLAQVGIQEPLWYASILGFSLLYIAQVDPGLQDQSEKQKRHWLRSLATGLICLTAFYQAEIGITGIAPVGVGLIAIALEFAFILAGLLLRVRAFLYVGTATFIAQVLWQLWKFISDYSLMLWALGIVLGLILIWVAATFEARRTQLNALLQNWISELERWQ
jgi:hypothetical protein